MRCDSQTLLYRVSCWVWLGQNSAKAQECKSEFTSVFQLQLPLNPVSHFFLCVGQQPSTQHRYAACSHLPRFCSTLFPSARIRWRRTTVSMTDSSYYHDHRLTGCINLMLPASRILMIRRICWVELFFIHMQQRLHIADCCTSASKFKSLSLAV